MCFSGRSQVYAATCFYIFYRAVQCYYCSPFSLGQGVLPGPKSFIIFSMTPAMASAAPALIGSMFVS